MPRAPPSRARRTPSSRPSSVTSRRDPPTWPRAPTSRELHGDLSGAATAMGLAVDAGGQAPENVAYVQTLLGTLEFDRGRIAEARRAYTIALLRQPGFPAADAGLARVEAAQRR